MPRLLRTHNGIATLSHPSGLIVLRRLRALRNFWLSFFSFFLLKNSWEGRLKRETENNFLPKESENGNYRKIDR